MSSNLLQLEAPLLPLFPERVHIGLHSPDDGALTTTEGGLWSTDCRQALPSFNIHPQFYICLWGHTKPDQSFSPGRFLKMWLFASEYSLLWVRPPQMLRQDFKWLNTCTWH